MSDRPAFHEKQAHSLVVHTPRSTRWDTQSILYRVEAKASHNKTMKNETTRVSASATAKPVAVTVVRLCESAVCSTLGECNRCAQVPAGCHYRGLETILMLLLLNCGGAPGFLLLSGPTLVLRWFYCSSDDSVLFLWMAH